MQTRSMEASRKNSTLVTVLIYWVVAYLFLLLVIQLGGRDLSLKWIVACYLSSWQAVSCSNDTADGQTEYYP
jgi:hypothetical protein